VNMLLTERLNMRWHQIQKREVVCSEEERTVESASSVVLQEMCGGGTPGGVASWWTRCDGSSRRRVAGIIDSCRRSDPRHNDVSVVLAHQHDLHSVSLQSGESVRCADKQRLCMREKARMK
jgi:hypothetical protein